MISSNGNIPNSDAGMLSFRWYLQTTRMRESTISQNAAVANAETGACQRNELGCHTANPKQKTPQRKLESCSEYSH
jgi:hypothetical protein